VLSLAEQNQGTNPLSVFAVLLSLLFVAGKVFGIGVTQTWSWWAVLSPVLIWFGFGLVVLLVVILVALVATAVAKSKK
jgi:hypothetical protein